MMRKQILGTGFATLLVSVGAGAQAQQEPAAALAELQGTVLVNQGEGMVRAQPGMPLGIDDRVLTLNESGVLVVYEDGCTIRLEENSLLTLMSADECTQGVAAADEVSEVAAFSAIGAGGIASTAGATLIAGGAFAGLAFAAGAGDTEEPVSPSQP